MGLVNGTVGYTRASYLGEVITDWKTLDEDDMRWNIVETALSYNGSAHRAGGRTPEGMDALGLVAMSYMLNGIVLPHSLTLSADGPLESITTKEMGEGDVLFFAAASMGIYIGDDRFVHATDLVGSEGVVVSSLNPKDEDYRADLAGNITAVGTLF